MKCERLSWDLLVKAVDKELSAGEAQFVTDHLAQCAECRREREEIERFSGYVAASVNRAAVVEEPADREQFAARIGQQARVKAIRAPEKVLRRFGWGMAIAATLAMGLIIAPRQKAQITDTPASRKPAAATGTSAIEVDGETFVALPYSNPDLPSLAPRIVQMQVPLSSLAAIGIALGPVASQVLNQDRSVLADVLLGADGQPLGVHVVSWE
jgi:anti-sigma factor RsiW